MAGTISLPYSPRTKIIYNSKGVSLAIQFLDQDSYEEERSGGKEKE